VRRSRRNVTTLGQPPGDHDGILDVLANLVGVLTLVGALSAIVAANAALRIKTPMARSTTKSFELLVVGRDGIWNLQPANDALNAANKARVAELKGCLGYDIYTALDCINNVSSNVRSARVGQARFVLGDNEVSLQRIGEPDIRTEGDNSDSQIKSLVATISKKKRAIFVLLEKEGFAGYRKLRAAAGTANVELGWEPWKTGAKVFFGGNGRSMTVQ
jgi:hypothetical protein